ncbi:MAG TPA: DNA polymerase III subunit delta [Ktedonobacterales bacterium]|nr:DNA polymerase III subunit delta [Ktedonobacterales bacterium]
MFLLYHGPDEFSAHEALARLRATHDFGYNQDTFTGAGADLATIRNTCDTMPFLSEQRLVVVDGLPKRKRGGKDDGADDSSSPPSQGEGSGEGSAKSGKGKKGKTASGPDPKAFAAGLAEYVPSLPEFSILVLLADEVLDAASPLLKAAQKFGKAQAFLLPRGPQLEDWVARRAASHDAKLAPEAARLLAVEVGDNLRLLALEIEKLATYVGQGETIRVEDVRTLTPASRQAKVFDLTDALARRDRKRALALLHELLAAGESPLGIVALTAFQTRSLLQVKTLAEQGLRAPQIAQTAGMAPFVVEKTLPLARQFSFAQLEAAHRSLLEIDIALKRSKMTPEMALDLLVVEFGITGSRP